MRRVSMTIDDDLYRIIQKRRVAIILKENKSYSFSRMANDLMRRGLEK